MANPETGLTVAIATLDRPEGLARCLAAIEAGVRLPDEIVVIDQSAGDETERLAARAWRGRTRLRYARQPRRGLSASRNAAMELAACGIVAMTDDDCVPGEGWVAALAAAFADEAVSAVSGRVLPYGPERPGLYAVSSRVSTEPRAFAAKASPWLAGSGGNFAARRAVWARIGGFDERLGAGSPGKAAEDMDFIYRLLRNGQKIVYEPNAVIYHERQDLSRRIASRWTYGYGIGGLCGKWLRRGDPYALRLLGGWSLARTRELWGAVRRGSVQARRESWLMLKGTAAGVGYGLRLSGASK